MMLPTFYLQNIVLSRFIIGMGSGNFSCSVRRGTWDGPLSTFHTIFHRLSGEKSYFINVIAIRRPVALITCASNRAASTTWKREASWFLEGSEKAAISETAKTLRCFVWFAPQRSPKFSGIRTLKSCRWKIMGAENTLPGVVQCTPVKLRNESLSSGQNVIY